MKITVNNKNIEVAEGAILEDVIKKHFKEKNIVAANVDNVLRDLSDSVVNNSNIELVTTGQKDGLDILRHTCAHIFGHAIKQIYPDVKMVIGPVIENGFYYDILSETPITEKDLALIENRMRKLVKKNYAIKREVVPKNHAIAIFEERKNLIRLNYLKK